MTEKEYGNREGFSKVETLYEKGEPVHKTHAAQLRQERNFRKLMKDSYKNKGVEKTDKAIYKEWLEYKNKSEKVKLKQREEYLKGAQSYRGYDEAGISITQKVEKPDFTGDIYDKPDFAEGEEPEGVKLFNANEKIREQNQTINQLNKALELRDKQIEELTRRLEKLEKAHR